MRPCRRNYTNNYESYYSEFSHYICPALPRRRNVVQPEGRRLATTLVIRHRITYYIFVNAEEEDCHNNCSHDCFYLGYRLLSLPS